MRSIRLSKQGAVLVKKKHPWVLAKNCLSIPKGMKQGEAISLTDDKDNFLALAYGNPKSKIFARVLSYKNDRSIFSQGELTLRLQQAWDKRLRDQSLGPSYRLCFSEGDQLPGLIVDYYRNANWQVFALQISTAGMEQWMVDPYSLLKNVLTKGRAENWDILPWEQTSIVLRNDVSSRKAEGLSVEFPRIIKTSQDIQLENFEFLLRDLKDGKERSLSLRCDILGGQKTGFFFDQVSNVQKISDLVSSEIVAGSSLRILDLCPYVGHWSARLAKRAQSARVSCEVTLVDASEKALAFAKENLADKGARFELVCGDVFQEMAKIKDRQFDVVIVDPPAFVKRRQDLPQGLHAYLKLNSTALQLCSEQAWFVTSSCSGHVRQDDFDRLLQKAQDRSGRKMDLVYAGGQGADHPVPHEFPEGEYLKTKIFRLL